MGKQDTGEKKPVFVVCHHGDFAYGGAADPLMDDASYVHEHPGKPDTLHGVDERVAVEQKVEATAINVAYQLYVTNAREASLQARRLPSW